MKAKLIKTGNDYLLKEYGYGETLAITSGTMEGRKLSLKNCEAIANGYDLDELVNLESPKNSTTGNISEKIGFVKGFQKALEILGDKKFSINEVVELTKILISNPFEKCGKTYQELTDSYIQSLQQTEWDVEIYTLNDCQGDFEKCNKENFNCVLCTDTGLPKLDENGCLILKQI